MPPTIEDLDLSGFLFPAPGLCKSNGPPRLSLDPHQGTQKLSRSFAHHAQTMGSKEHCLSFYLLLNPSTLTPCQRLAKSLGWKSHSRIPNGEWVKTPSKLAFYSHLCYNILPSRPKLGHVSGSSLSHCSLVHDFPALMGTGFLLHLLVYRDLALCC